MISMPISFETFCHVHRGKKFSPIYLKSNANESSPLIRLLYLERPYNRVMRRKRIDEIRNADHDCTIEINRVRVQI